MISKKAKLLSLWWFFVLVVVAGAAIGGVLIVKGQPVDVRVLENDIIINKIAECLITNSHINQTELFKADILKCGFSKKMEDAGAPYFLKIELLNSSDSLIIPQTYWNTNLELDCKIFTAVKTAESYPICSNKRYNVINETGGNMAIRITAGSKYLGSY
jgi:hypothetical protein